MYSDLPFAVTNDHAQLLVAHHFDESLKAVKVIELANRGFSYSSTIRAFIIDIQDRSESTSAAFLTISSSDPSPSGTNPNPYPPNSLATLHIIISRILSSTSIPIASSSIIDTSLTLVPFPYILSPASPEISSDEIMSLGEARRRGLLGSQPNDPRQLRVDLMLGRFLGEVHRHCVNDWFGVPEAATSKNGKASGTGASALITDPEPPNSYSWQETFTALFEAVLSEIEATLISTSGAPQTTQTTQLPFQRIRLLFARAIGSFLFDDVEEPSLVWFTGSEEDIYVSSAAAPASSLVTAILPNLSHAVWGDPLLESFFIGFSELPSITSTPSDAFMEAYISSGGSDKLIVFTRQKNKRIWYTLFLGLVVLRERLNGGTMVQRSRSQQSDRDGGLSELPHLNDTDHKGTWAKEIISECVQALEKPSNY